MNTKKRPYQRHFPYKHPTFGTRKSPKNRSSWENSIYYWWWMYIKRNESYLNHTPSDANDELDLIYRDFGDVSGDDFKSWWMENGRGAKLFANQQANDSIRVLDASDLALTASETLTISIPLYLPKKIILTKIKQLVDKNHRGKRGYQLAKKSTAKYKVNGQPNIPAIRMALTVYDFQLKNPQMKLWEIGNALPMFQMEHKIQQLDTPQIITAKKNILASTVSRYLRRAKESIENTTKGRFP